MSLTKPRLRSDLESVEIDGEAILYDPVNTSVHHLNATATAIASMFDGTVTIRALTQEISEAYDVPAEEVEPEVRRLVRQFRKLQLLEPSRG
jgi:PqqD family protein of HPr-rel-A system